MSRTPRQHSVRRHLMSIVVALFFVGLFAVGAGVGQITDLHWPSFPSFARENAPHSRPTAMSIPAISVRAAVKPVGRASDGSIAVPDLSRTHTTGWYDRGPSPGDPGAAVIVGHVDDKHGPSVFYRIHTLRPGDHIIVTRRDHKVLTFVVDSVAQYPKDAFPVGRVFAPPPNRPALRLITCGGEWVGGETGYADNIIVFATLAA